MVLLFALLGDQRLNRPRERGIVALARSPDEAKDEISTRHNNRMTVWAARCRRPAGSAATTGTSWLTETLRARAITVLVVELEHDVHRASVPRRFATKS